MGCLHPVVKVQSASIHFFLDSDQDDDEMGASDDEATLLSYTRILSLNSSAQGPDLKTLQHRREINKKTRSGERKLGRQIKNIKRVRSPVILVHPHQTSLSRNVPRTRVHKRGTSLRYNSYTTPKLSGRDCTRTWAVTRRNYHWITRSS